MKSGFTKTSLGSIFSFTNGKAIKPGGEGAYPAYGSNGLIGHSMKAKHEKAIVIGRVGAYCGSVIYSEEPFWASDNTIVAELKDGDTDIKYLYYLLKSMDLNWYAGGSAQPLLTQSVLKNLEIEIPPLPVQRRVAGLLSAYDDLIAVNERRIALLEAMAQAVYRAWFVHLRFPGHEEAERQETEALGAVPAAWEVDEMAELLNRHMDTVKPYESEGETFDYFSFEAHDEGGLPLPEKGAEIRSKKHEVKQDAVLLSKLNPRIPRIWMTALRGERRSITSTEFMVLVPKPPATQSYLYAFLSSPGFLRRLKSLVSGTSTSHQRVSPRDFLSMPVAVPSKAVVEQFTGIAGPMLHQAQILRLKNENLRRTRDLLLPRLVGGEVAVDNVDDVFQNA